MAKYTVKFSCGHIHQVVLSGRVADQERKVQWYKDCGICPDCYATRKAAELEATCETVEMHYGEYKNNYSGCKTVKDSYNAATKTIRVYVPSDYKTPAQKKAEAEAQEAYMAEQAAKITKSDMFRRAHAYTKQLLSDSKYTGIHYDYRATFGLVLKEFYAIQKSYLKKASA